MSSNTADVEALFFEGNRRMEAGDSEGAEGCFRLALALVPDFAEVITNLGLLQESRGEVAEAEACYRRSITLSPGTAQNYLNLGVLLMNRKSFSDSELVYRQALALAPNSPAAWSNLGVLLACTKREDEAEQCYRTAMKLDRNYGKAQFNLAYVLLRQGRFAEGWQRLEARDWYAILTKHFACPRWQGEPLTGKSIVIGFEAGHGDMIQFSRYAMVLKDLGVASITLLCHPALKILFGTLQGVDAVLSFVEHVPNDGWDFWSPPLSLPYYCGTGGDIPAPIPYLSADPAKVEQWSRQLPDSECRVGMVWKGNPRFENDADRSIPSLELLAPLWAVTGVQFVSLQKGFGEGELWQPPSGINLLAVGASLEDFADTAAVVANLDLVISVDTAVAHLAGAMGIPCWVLLPDYRTDWRWMTERSDSPWYPKGMRLFRQSSNGSWPPVIATVAEELSKWVASSTRT